MTATTSAAARSFCCSFLTWSKVCECNKMEAGDWWKWFSPLADPRKLFGLGNRRVAASRRRVALFLSVSLTADGRPAGACGSSLLSRCITRATCAARSARRPRVLLPPSSLLSLLLLVACTSYYCSLSFFFFISLAFALPSCSHSFL